MNKKALIGILLAVFVVLMVGASFLYNNLKDQMGTGGLVSNQTQEEIKENAGETEKETEPENSGETGAQYVEAPDFTVLDWDGKEVSLSDFRGKPVVLNFWASWCGPCKSEMPDFHELYLEYKDEIHFVMVNLTDGSRETMDSAKKFIEKSGYEFPVYFDTEYEGAIAYGVTGIPVTYIIDENGYAIAQGQRALSKEELQSGIDMVYPY